MSENKFHCWVENLLSTYGVNNTSFWDEKAVGLSRWVSWVVPTTRFSSYFL